MLCTREMLLIERLLQGSSHNRWDDRFGSERKGLEENDLMD
jgi:uncharacterized protein YodC (DUF2158 family)